MDKIKHYLSLVKFSHTIFALPFAMIGFALALKTNKPFELKVFVLVVLCMVFARSAAMAFNRYIDRHFDKLNPRTAVREIPAGTIHAKHALSFVIINSLLFIASCVVCSFVLQLHQTLHSFVSFSIRSWVGSCAHWSLFSRNRRF